MSFLLTEAEQAVLTGLAERCGLKRGELMIKAIVAADKLEDIRVTVEHRDMLSGSGKRVRSKN